MHVRVTAAFNRLLGFSGTVVEEVVFSATQILVSVRLRSRRLRCPCGRTSPATYDRSQRSWRHVDLGRFKVVVRAQVRRVDCHGCGRVRTEQVPWARPGARHTRDFEDTAAWLVRRMSKAAVATLLRTSWNTVDGLVQRLVTAHLNPEAASHRLARLTRIGVDEIAYRKGRKFLTIVTDHDTGHVVWVREGRTQTALIAFLDTLGPVRERIRAISMDMTRIYREAARIHLPQAAICYDPFHLIKWVGEALDQVHLATPRDGAPIQVDGLSPAKTWQKVRTTLRAAAENLDATGKAIINQLRIKQKRLYRAWQLKENLRALYKGLTAEAATRHLDKWCRAATRSNINAFMTLARRIRHHFDGIIAAVSHRLSNSRIEGINAGIRLIQRRANGYASLDNLIEMIHLCHGGVPTRLPTHP
jgi:transposase